MRGFVLAVVAVILGAGALSVAILPSRQELGTMYLRDRKYEESRALFERQIAEGDLSPQTVSGLLSIYLQYGDVDRAIELTRQFGAAIGDRPDVLARLAELYLADRRLGLYRQTLKRLIAVEPTAARLEALADASLRAADRPGRADALRQLVDRGWATPDRFLELAELSLALLRLDDARDALLAVAERSPQSLDWSQRATMVQLLLRAGRVDSAAGYSTAWLDGTEPEAIRTYFAQIWMEAGLPLRTLALLDSRPEMEPTSETWRVTYALALQRAGREDDAFDRLRQWLPQGLVTPALSIDFIALAVARRDLDAALAVFDSLGVARLPFAAIPLLVSALHQARRPADVDRVLAAVGPERMAELPILAAEIALARGDTAAARRWADAALARPMPGTDDRLALAPILIALGDDAGAFGLLRPLADGAAPPLEALLLLGELHARSADPEQGYWEVNALLARRYTPELRAVWAELAVATGRDQEVREWLEMNREVPARTLGNLFFIAERRESWGIAIDAARRTLQLQPSDQARERLAFALLRAGRPGEALEVYDAVPRDTPQAESLYADILLALGLRDRLVALWQEQIARPGTPPERVRELVYNLLDAGADAAAWPHLLALARAEGGSWWFALADSAVRSGLGAAAAEAIAAETARRPVDDEGLSALLAALDAASAEATPAALRALADRSPALWADSYAFALRDRGRIKELNAWLAARLAATGNPSEALLLAQRLAETADPLDAARAVRPRAALGRGWADLYVDLLRRGQRPKEALDFLVGLAGRGGIDPAWRREIAFQALEAGNREAADRLFRAVAAEEPPDGPAVQQLFFLWGPRPERSALEWIEARARAARGAERAAWLERLLAVRAGDRVIAVIGGVAGASGPAEVDLAVRAQAQAGQPEKLREAVTAAVDRTRDVAALERLARTAETTRDRKLVVDAWRAVVAAQADHPTANRELGLIAYDEGRLVDAERHLRAYLGRGAGDYEASYFLGEVLFRTGRKDQAGPFYQRAFDQLRAMPDRDFNRDVARANILRRLGRLDDAAALLGELLAQRPKDRALRADYADLLIEKGDFARARYVLQLR